MFLGLFAPKSEGSEFKSNLGPKLGGLEIWKRESDRVLKVDSFNWESYSVINTTLIILQVDEELELIHSSIETLAACIQISIRGISAYLEYRSIKSHVVDIEVSLMLWFR